MTVIGGLINEDARYDRNSRARAYRNAVRGRYDAGIRIGRILCTRLRAAGVAVRLTGDDEGIQTATTDGAGRFAFRQVAPRVEYKLTTSRDGYVTAEYGARGPGRPGEPFVIQGSEQRDDLGIGLTRTGAISGRVRDIFGQPVVYGEPVV